MNTTKKRVAALVLLAGISVCIASMVFAETKEDLRKKEIETMQEKFSWWPSDAKPGPVKDELKGGYWWMPTQPGEKSGKVWGNRGYLYVRKIIFDYKEDELPAPQPQELRPSLIIRKIMKNVKIYFDYDKSDIRDDAASILDEAVNLLKKNPSTDILITGNCDVRGTEKYNEKLGKARGESVRVYMINKGIPEDRIRIISRGKLDAISPVTDLVGMQKDRNAQFMVAEVEEVMMAYAGKPTDEVKAIEEEKVVEEKKEEIEGQVKVSTKDYVIQPGDSLWKIAESQMGSGHRWKYLYEVNKDKIKNPKKLRAGQTIVIPIE